MRATIIGKTEAILSLNALGIQIQGRVIAKDIEINTKAEKAEIEGLEKSGFIKIIYETKDIPVTEEARGANDSKTKENDTGDGDGEKDSEKPIKKIPTPENIEPKSEQQRVLEAEAKTQKEGSRVIISVGEGTIETKMIKSFAGEAPESEATKASIKAMDKLEKKEKEEEEEDAAADENPPVNEEDLPPEEQMGRVATIIDEGSDKKVDMVNTAIPGAAEAKDGDPFIDKADPDTKDEKEDLKSDMEDFFEPDEDTDKKTDDTDEDPDEDMDEEDDPFVEW